MTIHESEADERTYEKALAEENAHQDQDFGCRANYSVRCASGWMAHCISVGMEGKPGATLGRMAALNTPQCQAASATVRASTRVMYWVSHSAVLDKELSLLAVAELRAPANSHENPSSRGGSR
jgi:hypothetical protein